MGKIRFLRRRRFPRVTLLSLFFAVAFFPLTEIEVVASRKSFFPPDEEFTYALQFLSILKAGESQIKIRRKSGYLYEATMVAQTNSIFGFFSRYRQNSYLSEMEFIPDQGRFVTRHFTKLVTWGGESRKSVSEIDYDKKVHRWVVRKNGNVKVKGSEKIPDGVIYEDLLSAFFNLRYQAFGPLERGRHIRLSSQPFSQVSMLKSKGYTKKFIRTFEIRIADFPTEREYRHRFGRTNENGLLVLFNVPNDFFGQNNGDVIIWFDKKLVPVATTVEDVFLFGDVTGSLVNFKSQPTLPIQVLGSK